MAADIKRIIFQLQSFINISIYIIWRADIKKITISLMLILTAMSTAQAEENNCFTLLEKMKEYAAASGDQDAADEVDIDGFREEWNNMSTEEHQKANAECAELMKLMRLN
ncbi:hypothetical protein KRX19_02725 [Cardiobacteriaceae bacterium TAE3-ERU3]|nr:hypothetical protein [Cardiobacteriaceae bacterium TAE3-ERU3]